MKERDKKTDQQRRDFLRGTVATGAGVVLAAATADGAVADTTDLKADATTGKQSGYRLSQHVLDYYKTCLR